MSLPDYLKDLGSVQLFLAFFIPGFIIVQTYNFFVPAGESDWGKRLPEIVSYSAVDTLTATRSIDAEELGAEGVEMRDGVAHVRSLKAIRAAMDRYILVDVTSRKIRIPAGNVGKRSLPTPMRCKLQIIAS